MKSGMPIKIGADQSGIFGYDGFVGSDDGGDGDGFGGDFCHGDVAVQRLYRIGVPIRIAMPGGIIIRFIDDQNAVCVVGHDHKIAQFCKWKM